MTISDEFYSEVQQAVAKHQPELTVSRADRFISLAGLFVVSGPAGPFDAYKIKVIISGGFPNDEPMVFEEGGRIKRIANLHVFPKHGNCCLGVWEEWLLTTPEQNFECFLTGPLHDYFVSQTYFSVHEEWPYGQRAHGTVGVLEAYGDLLGIPPNEKTIIDYLRLLSRQKIKGHALCPCGSGKRLRQCHSEDLHRLSQVVPTSIAKRMYRKIVSAKPR